MKAENSGLFRFEFRVRAFPATLVNFMWFEGCFIENPMYCRPGKSRGVRKLCRGPLVTGVVRFSTGRRHNMDSFLVSPAIRNCTKGGGLKVLFYPCIFFPNIPHKVFFPFDFSSLILFLP